MHSSAALLLRPADGGGAFCSKTVLRNAGNIPIIKLNTEKSEHPVIPVRRTLVSAYTQT